MKILVISDTHRRHKQLEEILGRIRPDLLIHLGDVEGYENYIEVIADCPVHIIAGNNDFFSELKREDEFYIGKYKVFICHGHQYGVSRGTGRLLEKAEQRKADIVMFGHTHKPGIKVEKGVVVLNPGSISYPRQENRKGSFVLMEIDRKEEAHFTINYV